MITEHIVEIDKTSPLYPKAWQDVSGAPEKIWAVGNTRLLTARKITVVGSRTTPAGALKLGSNIARELSQIFTVVTGTADGGDCAAIEGALAGSRNVICVLAGGFSALPQGNMALMEKVAKNGLIIAMHPYDTPVRAFSYEYRNKMLAYVSEGVLVLGAAEKSGALITAKYARKANRKVFALPYAPNTFAGAGCNALIKAGAALTENATDILTAFGIEKTEQKPKLVLTADEEKVLTILRELSEAHASELAQKSGVPIFKLRAVLSALEVKGLAVSVGGNSYKPV